MTPGRLHLLLLNLLIAALQLLLIILAFAEAARAEGMRAGTALLGQDEVEPEEEEDEHGLPIRELHGLDEDDEDVMCESRFRESRRSSSADVTLPRQTHQSPQRRPCTARRTRRS